MLTSAAMLPQTDAQSPAAAPPQKITGKSARLRIALGVIVLIAVAGGVKIFLSLRPDTLTLVGTVELKSVQLAAPVSERIAEILATPGQRVEPGQAIVQFEDEVAQLELTASTASHSASEVTYEAARQEYERLGGLSAARIVSPQELDRAKKSRDEALAIKAERAARMAQAQRLLADLTLRAPEAGTVDQIAYEVGERVPAGGVVAVVVSNQSPWVRLWIPARAIVQLTPGWAAEVEIHGIAGVLKGRLQDIGREPEFTPHFALTEAERDHLVYESRVLIDNAPTALRPGVPATVRIRLPERRRQ